MVLVGTTSREHPVIQEYAGVPLDSVLGLLDSILGLTLFLLHLNYLPDNVICDIVIYTDDTTFYSECDQASDLRQQR